jgi:dihydrofolate synthase/folylpolyglutamate synthase
MSSRTLREWLSWQETLNPEEIDLGLGRMQRMVTALQIGQPPPKVITVAGTNGKGSCSAAIERLLRANGYRTGWYSSPHLLNYNERICVDGQPVQDDDIVNAFERIEALRGDTPLTFFEYGTLAALDIFDAQACDVWVLEVGLGGRLDAVNVIDASIAVITTVGLDHQDWLGTSIDAIAAEKAGIMRRGRPVFFGDRPVPETVCDAAAASGAELLCLGEAFDYELMADSWNWRGRGVQLGGLSLPPGAGEEQVRNLSVSLAAAEAFDPGLLADTSILKDLAAAAQLPGRYQRHTDTHEWWLDVAHNPQAAAALAVKLRADRAGPLTVVLAMQRGKDVAAFAAQLDTQVSQWIALGVGGYRAVEARELADLLEPVVTAPVELAGSVDGALELARERAGEGGSILICGSFMLVGPALQALGLY